MATNGGNMIKLGLTLFHTDHKIFEVVDSDLTGNYLDWNLVPLPGPTLAREHTLSGLADGYFILEGQLVRSGGDVEKAYIDVGLPEREIDWHFLMKNDGIVRGRGTLIPGAQIIPAVGIEKFGAYDQYYVKGHAEIGLNVLREGLANAKLKWPIAGDLAYILRDEKRYREAIEAFSIVISNGNPTDYYPYAERAMLFDRIGDQAAADRDWEHVKSMAGPEMLKSFRGF